MEKKIKYLDEGWVEPNSIKWNDADMENAFDEGVLQEKERDPGDWNDFATWLLEYKRTYDPTPSDPEVRPDVIKYDEQVLEYRMMISSMIRAMNNQPLPAVLFCLVQAAIQLLDKYPSQPDNIKSF